MGGGVSLRDRRAGMAFIFVTLLIDVLGFGLIIPVLPRLVTTLTGGSLSSGARLYGLLLSCYGLMQFLFAPVLGSLSDHYGRRPVLLLSVFFSGVDYVIMALAPAIGWLFLGRILSGIAGASFTTANAYIADVSPPEKRAQNFGMIGAAFGIGFIIGPAVGGILGTISPRAPFWAAAAMSFINTLYGLFVLPESLPRDQRRRFSFITANPIGALKILSRYPWVLLLAGSIALQALAQQAVQSTWVLYTAYRFRWTELGNGMSLALLGLASIVVQVGLIKMLVARLGESKTMLWGLLFSFIGFVGFALASRSWMMIAVMLVWTLSFVVGPTTQSLVSRQFGNDEQGASQGALTSIQSLTGIVGPVVAAWVFGYFTSRNAPIHLPGAAFMLGAILVAFSAIMAGAALRRRSAALRAV